jgi:hypothetical protein
MQCVTRCLSALIALLATSGSEGRNLSIDSSAPAVATMHRLTRFVFDTSVPASGTTRALGFRDQGYAFESLEQINKYNVQSSRRRETTTRSLQLTTAPLESSYWWRIRHNSEADGFVRGLAAVLHTSSLSDQSAQTVSSQSVLQKALWQRDLFQTYGLLQSARSGLSAPDSLSLADDAELEIARLFKLTLLSSGEYQALLKLRPQRVPASFVAESDFDGSQNYLPNTVIAVDRSWLEIPGTGEPFRHFKDYGGRSFIRVYVRARDLSTRQVQKLWTRLFERHGANLHTSAVGEEVPIGFESVLVRTFGVFLRDGSYRNSYWPEEVIIRQFKYPASRVDLGTSDFRGTLLYQYRMSREALLTNPHTLGLRRVAVDELQFAGFFGDVPDPHNAYSDLITTMRANCISCHSELFYGLNTVFSFERDPRSRATNNLLRAGVDGRYELLTPEYKSLQSRLRSL